MAKHRRPGLPAKSSGGRDSQARSRGLGAKRKRGSAQPQEDAARDTLGLHLHCGFDFEPITQTFDWRKATGKVFQPYRVKTFRRSAAVLIGQVLSA